MFCLIWFNYTLYSYNNKLYSLIDISIWVIYADVIGVVTGVCVEKEYEREGVKTKTNVIEFDSNG